MNMTIKRGCSLLVALVIATTCFTACDDPQKAILKVFTDEGLSLLEPARSYIKLGGIFAVPKHGQIVYFDPYDTIPSDPGTATDFSAIVEKQSTSQSTGISVAMSLLAQLIKLPVGLTFDTSKTVKLDQIDTGGTRYSSDKIDALLASANTAKKLNSLLGSNDGTRVYLVQELYTAKSLSITTTDNTSLSASLGAAGKVPSCSSGSNSGSTTKPTTGANQATGNASTNGSNAGNSSSNQATKTKTNSTTKSQQNPTNSSSSKGVSFGACHDVDSSLSFTSKTDIPFAVRLNEIYIAPDKTLSVRVNGFTLPNHALGTTDTKASTWIDPNSPTLKGFVHNSQQ
jgi:hypothetical protein